MCVPVQLWGALYQPWQRFLRAVQPLRLTGSCLCSGRMCRIDMPSRKLAVLIQRPYKAAYEHFNASNDDVDALRFLHIAILRTRTERVNLTSSTDI